MKIVFGVFLILHGLVHLLYMGQSWRLFELVPGLAWPDGSWTFSKLFGNETTRLLAALVCIVAAVGLVISGVGVFAEQSWWRSAMAAAVVVSSIGYFLLWNGKFQALHDQGAIGILINLALLVAAFVLKWPTFAF